MNLNRRQFLLGGGIALAAGVGGGLELSKSISTEVELKSVEIPVSGLPKEFRDYRIGFLTDIHLGLFLPEERLATAIDKLIASKPDMVVLGGDYVSIPRGTIERSWPVLNSSLGALSYSQLPAAALSMLTKNLSRLKPKDGLLAILGNHDHWISPITCSKALVQGAKAQVLVNQSTTIKRGQSRLSFLGVDDFWTGIPEFPLSAPADSGRHARVLLAHNPDYVDLLLKNEEAEKLPASFELALCGHTHGGQIHLPLLGPVTYNVSAVHLADGLYTATAGRAKPCQVFTSRGLGAVEIPVRYNCPPEVNLLTLTSA